MKKEQSKSRDIIIAGGGLAGLSLAWQLEMAFPGRYSMLLIDKEKKISNDRTWCFWEKTDGPFEDVVLRSWDHLRVSGPNWEKVLDIEPYKYKMIRSAALYEKIRTDLQDRPNIQWEYRDINKVFDLPEGGGVECEGATYEANWVFNSALRPKVPEEYPRFLLQHFKGFFLKTPEPAFDPGIPQFMDFRIEQEKDVRFVYVLPFSSTEALAEYTIFSPSLWDDKAYEDALDNYLRNTLGLDHYEVMEKEFGLIPMTDFRFPLMNGKHVMNIGTAGGMTKASTGYTFVNTLRQCAAIIESIEQHGHPFKAKAPGNARFRFYDGILLDVLTKNRFPGSEIFRYMFRKNKESLVFDFLGEDSRFHQELGLFLSFPQLPFIKGFLSVAGERFRKA